MLIRIPRLNMEVVVSALLTNRIFVKLLTFNNVTSFSVSLVVISRDILYDIFNVLVNSEKSASLLDC